MTTGETPRTEAGRALLDDPHGTAGILDAWGGDDLRHAILAIEREAAAAPPEPPRPDHFETPQHTAIYADLDTIIQAAERAINLLHDAESRVAGPEGLSLDVEELTDIIEQAIFETDTGLAAALLAADRIHARIRASSGESGSPGEPE